MQVLELAKVLFTPCRGRQETPCPETAGEVGFIPAFAGAPCTEPVWSKKSFGVLGEGGTDGGLVMPGAVTQHRKWLNKRFPLLFGALELLSGAQVELPVQDRSPWSRY